MILPSTGNIHPTAFIHPSAYIEGDVDIGEDSKIGPNCYIQGPVKIGKRTEVRANTVIGTDGESKGKISIGTILIGDDTFISDLVTIQRSIGQRDTEVGNNCYIMAHCHLGHDVKLYDGVTISPGTMLGGHVQVLPYATIGLGVTVHQYRIIGGYSMIGMNSTVVKDIPPFQLAVGTPARAIKLNTYQVNKLGISEEKITENLVYCEAIELFKDRLKYQPKNV